jgi:hypothetical protein
MEQRHLRRLGPRVSAIGLGCMSLGIADIYTSSVRDDNAAVALLRRALDLGVTFLDTVDIYGDSEVKVGKAIKGRRADVVLATKCGFVQSEIGNEERIDGRPQHVREACERSLRRLEVDDIDVYYLHRVDPKVPIEDTVGGMAELVRQGKVRQLGCRRCRRRHCGVHIAFIPSLPCKPNTRCSAAIRRTNFSRHSESRASRWSLTVGLGVALSRGASGPLRISRRTIGVVAIRGFRAVTSSATWRSPIVYAIWQHECHRPREAG